MVERRSPKPEVVGSSPSAPAKLIKLMKNPLKFIQEVKQETFKITWPTKKDTMMGAVMVFFALASIAAIFFLIIDQVLRFLLNLILTINF